MNIIEQLESEEIQRLGVDIPLFGAGDTVSVKCYVIEGQNKRIQNFEGVVIAKKNRGLNSSFVVRRMASGGGVERTFQTYSPIIESINVIRHGDVKRGKIYYLRQRQGRSARIKEKLGAKKQVKAA